LNLSLRRCLLHTIIFEFCAANSSYNDIKLCGLKTVAKAICCLKT
jgi:hypothetical protein